MDVTDIASEQEELERERELAKIKAIQQQTGSEFCEDCGEIIPLARRQLAPWTTRCIHCQTSFEKKMKHYR